MGDQGHYNSWLQKMFNLHLIARPGRPRVARRTSYQLMIQSISHILCKERFFQQRKDWFIKVVSIWSEALIICVYAIVGAHKEYFLLPNAVSDFHVGDVRSAMHLINSACAKCSSLVGLHINNIERLIIRFFLLNPGYYLTFNYYFFFFINCLETPINNKRI